MCSVVNPQGKFVLAGPGKVIFSRVLVLYMRAEIPSACSMLCSLVVKLLA